MKDGVLDRTLWTCRKSDYIVNDIKGNIGRS